MIDLDVGLIVDWLHGSSVIYLRALGQWEMLGIRWPLVTKNSLLAIEEVFLLVFVRFLVADFYLSIDHCTSFLIDSLLERILVDEV